IAECGFEIEHRRERGAVGSNFVDRTESVKVRERTPREDHPSTVCRETRGYLVVVRFTEQKVLPAAIAIHEPKLRRNISRKSRKNNLPGIGRPVFPKCGVVSAEVCELPDIASIRIHRVDVRTLHKRDAAVEAGLSRSDSRPGNREHDGNRGKSKAANS